jgi:hypothetical protein
MGEWVGVSGYWGVESNQECTLSSSNLLVYSRQHFVVCLILRVVCWYCSVVCLFKFEGWTLVLFDQMFGGCGGKSHMRSYLSSRLVVFTALLSPKSVSFTMPS